MLGFTFERALTYPFKAPHFKSFPWLFGMMYGLTMAAMTVAAMLLSKTWFVAFMERFEAIDVSGPDDVLELVRPLVTGILPIAVFWMLAFWVVSSMFTTATMRRYVRDEKFSLGFGADEMRVMVVYLFWTALCILVMSPILVMWILFGFKTFSDMAMGIEPSETMIVTFVGGMFIAMIGLFPVFVFVATRLAPCFALTVKDRRVRCFDAWNVTRGRFWPLLGAYALLAIITSVVVSVLNQIFQTILMFGFPLESLAEWDSMSDMGEILFGPLVVTGIAVLVFIQSFLEGIMKHFVAAPAALAARHDPRNDLEQLQHIDVFS